MQFNLLTVCGLHRSGTTFVGRILREAGIGVIHEPLNERFGVVGVPIAYPFVDVSGGIYSKLIEDAVDFKRTWNSDPRHLAICGITERCINSVKFFRAPIRPGQRRIAPDEASVEDAQSPSGTARAVPPGPRLDRTYAAVSRRHIYALTGGRSGLHWSMLRLCKCLGVLPAQLCWKDPFATLSTPYLVNRFGARIVCMVRHPAAIHYSTEKKGWRFDVDNLLRQPELIARHGSGIPEAHWALARKHAAASIALLWKIMVRVNGPLAGEDERLLLMTHEDLCLEPVFAARRICEHLGIPFTARLERFVIQHSEGDRIEARDGKTHDFRRNSRALVDVWRGHLSVDDEAMIREISGDEVARFYGQW